MEKILDILKEIRPESDFANSADFVEDGLLDSFDIISLISMFEERFGAIVDGLDIVPENFNSLKAMENLIIKSGGKI